MKKIKNVSLIGLGAIGAAYASRLYDMDPECCRIIADKERIERYSKSELYINDKLYNFRYIEPGESCEPADLVLISVKYHHLRKAIEDIRNHVGPETIIISLMNGIDSEEIIGEKYGMDKMLYAMCLAIDALREGNNVRFTSFGQIHFGEKTNTTYSPKVEAVKEFFDRADIPYVVPENMMRSLWWKFMINVGINQTSAVLKAPYAVFLKVNEAHELMELAMLEVVALSKKTGINFNEEQVFDFDNILKKMSPKGKTSMLQDIDAGRKTEVEMFAGVIHELGQKYGIDTPVNDTLFKMIRTLEQMNNLK